MNLFERALSAWLDRSAADFLDAGPRADFAAPAGEAALVSSDSVSWRIFKNPVALFVGGVAAVILELAEPRVRTGVWEHSSFRTDPVGRLRRTGLAALTTVYGARSLAERMIAGVGRMHARIEGATPDGVAYRASDPALLTWVQGTAAYGFAAAYATYVSPLSVDDLDRFYAEGDAAARLYGASEPPDSADAIQRLFKGYEQRLEGSPIIFEFLEIMRCAPALPLPLRPMQSLFVRAAASLTPEWIRRRIGLGSRFVVTGPERMLMRRLGRLADQIVLPSSPAVQACRRLGLADDHLYVGPVRDRSAGFARRA